MSWLLPEFMPGRVFPPALMSRAAQSTQGSINANELLVDKWARIVYSGPNMKKQLAVALITAAFLIPTDLTMREFPAPYWAGNGVERLADRLAYYDVTSVKQLEAEEALLHKLRTEGRLCDRTELPVPAEAETVSPLRRPIYWGRQRAGTWSGASEKDVGGPTTRTVALKLYQLD